ncbi:hypothetical protein ACFONC_07360, partial [Luteimonas soli]
AERACHVVGSATQVGLTQALGRMKASPEIQALIGIGFMVYALVTIYAAIWRPKLLNNPFLRPRWWGFGPRASRAAAGVGSGAWLTIGAFVLGNALGILPRSASNLTFLLIFLFLIGAVIAQAFSAGDDAA